MTDVPVTFRRHLAVNYYPLAAVIAYRALRVKLPISQAPFPRTCFALGALFGSFLPAYATTVYQRWFLFGAADFR